MSKRRILQGSILLIVALTLACGWIPEPLETSLPPSPTLEIATTPDAPLVQIGYFDSIYLRYDPREWEIVNELQGQQQNNKGEPVASLRQRSLAGCFLHENLGRGAPPAWQVQSTNRVIGSLEYRVEAWTDTTTQKPVLTVYQYPAGEPGYGIRIELVIDQESEQCIQSAEDVLILSSDLISKH